MTDKTILRVFLDSLETLNLKKISKFEILVPALAQLLLDDNVDEEKKIFQIGKVLPQVVD